MLDREGELMYKLVLTAVAMYILMVPVAFLFSLIAAVPYYFIWNWVGPAIFHAPTIAFCHMWGLMVLLHLIALPFGTRAKT